MDWLRRDISLKVKEKVEEVGHRLTVVHLRAAFIESVVYNFINVTYTLMSGLDEAQLLYLKLWAMGPFETVHCVFHYFMLQVKDGSFSYF